MHSNFPGSPLNIAVKRSPTNAVSWGFTGGQSISIAWLSDPLASDATTSLCEAESAQGNSSTSGAFFMKLLRGVFDASTEELDCASGTKKDFDGKEDDAVSEAR